MSVAVLVENGAVALAVAKPNEFYEVDVVGGVQGLRDVIPSTDRLMTLQKDQLDTLSRLLPDHKDKMNKSQMADRINENWQTVCSKYAYSALRMQSIYDADADEEGSDAEGNIPDLEPKGKQFALADLTDNEKGILHRFLDAGKRQSEGEMRKVLRGMLGDLSAPLKQLLLNLQENEIAKEDLEFLLALTAPFATKGSGDSDAEDAKGGYACGSASKTDEAQSEKEPEVEDFTSEQVEEFRKSVGMTFIEGKTELKGGDLNGASSDTKPLYVILVGLEKFKRFIYNYKDGETFGDLVGVLNKAVSCRDMEVAFKFGESFLMSYQTISSVCDDFHNTVQAVPKLKGGGKSSTLKHIMKKKCSVAPSDKQTFDNLFATCALITSSQNCDLKKAMNALTIPELVELKKVLKPSRSKNDVKIAQMTAQLKEYKMLLDVKAKLETTIETMKEVVATTVYQDYMDEDGNIDLDTIRDLATASIVEKETLAKQTPVMPPDAGNNDANMG
eukprot:s1891_g19.t1